MKTERSPLIPREHTENLVLSTNIENFVPTFRGFLPALRNMGPSNLFIFSTLSKMKWQHLNQRQKSMLTLESTFEKRYVLKHFFHTKNSFCSLLASTKEAEMQRTEKYEKKSVLTSSKLNC